MKQKTTYYLDNGGTVLLTDGVPVGISDDGNVTLMLRRVLKDAVRVFGPLVATGNSGRAYGVGGRGRTVYVVSGSVYRRSKQGLLLRHLFGRVANGMTLADMVAELPNISRHTVREYINRGLQAEMLVSVKDKTVDPKKIGRPSKRFYLKELAP